jgi:phage gp45-like
MSTLFNKLGNLIRRAVITRPSTDTNPYQVAQVKYEGKTANAEIVYPYGLGGNPPTNSVCLMFNVSAQEENRAAIASTPTLRIKNLKEGEVYVSNLTTGSSVIFKNSGDIDVTAVGDVNIKSSADVNIDAGNKTNINASTEVSITAPNVTINGNATVNGNITATGAAGAASGSFGVSGLGIARLGDTVQVNTTTGFGTITSASTNNFAD